MTINEAIKEAMRIHGGPMTIREAYDVIVGAGLYSFHAETQYTWSLVNYEVIAKDSISLQHQIRSTLNFAVMTNTIFSNSRCGNLVAERQALSGMHRDHCCVSSKQSIRDTKPNCAQRSYFVFGVSILPHLKTLPNGSLRLMVSSI